MNLSRYVLASFRQYRRSHVPVMLGVAVATAVLTGALLVGDSVRGSLRNLTLQRLGTIDQALAAPQPFRAELADEISADPRFREVFDGVDSAFLLRGSITSGSGETKRSAGRASVVGVTARFGDHGDAPWAGDLKPGAVALTSTLAEELAANVGDEVVLRLPAVDALPADSPLGEKTDTTVGKRLVVAFVLPPTGLARFSLVPSQAPPRNAFVALATIQEVVDQPGRVNAILVDRSGVRPPEPPAADQLLNGLIRPRLDDIGLSADYLREGIVQVESNQLVLRKPVVEAAALALRQPWQPVVTYLANTLRVGDRSISYSTVSGVDSTTTMGPLLDASGKPIVLADDEVVLNDWAAEQLNADVGDTVTLAYYEPVSTHGELVEAEPLQLKLKAIVALRDGDGERTMAADPRLTPTLEGVTDADSIDDWDLPFELVEPITRADEDYWDEYSTTPKAFVSLNLAKRLWATRWGVVSLIRVAGRDASPELVSRSLRDSIEPADLGFVFQPVKQQGLQASSGTTPFDGLFFGFSLFLIASSVMLIALLFGVGVENRVREIGLLSSVGWGPPRVRAALIREGLMVASVGVLIGVPMGVAYAGLMIWGLTTLWVDAIVAPFLSLHAPPRSLLIGGAIGLAIAWATISLVVRRLLRTPARVLLAGQSDTAEARQSPAGWVFKAAMPALALAAVGLPIAAAVSGAQAEAQAGYFFGGGAALLATLLLLTRSTLRRAEVNSAAPNPFRLWSLAWRNVARNPGRSVLTLALVACASFLILAISAFRLDPSEAGTGGFVLIGQSAQPIHHDLNSEEGRLELGLGARDGGLIDEFEVHALRMHDGEDASCLNLYQTTQPRVLGVTAAALDSSRFAFAATAINTRLKNSKALTWRLLEGVDAVPGSSLANSAINNPQSAIPVLLDFNTAMYSLKLYGGVGSRLTIRDEADQPVEAVVVGLLKNSLLQGDLIVSEKNFLRLFPSAAGSRFFLIEHSRVNASEDELASILETRLSDFGMDIERAEARLARFLAVQNTYLSTFQTLGALGLLLGVVGVAVVQLRNLAERRGELALLRAGGFSSARLRWLVLRENLLLLGGGLLLGAVAAALALAPQTLSAAADARLPWSTTGLLLSTILVVGLVVGAYATRLALRAEIIPALRGD